MRCPFCRIDNDKVNNTRTSNDGFVVRRRRVCLNCNRRYSTAERFEELEIKVVKKDGVREPFNSQKLRAGLQKACWKRPISDDAIDSVVANVQIQVFEEYDQEIDSADLGELIMDELRQLDQVAYVRFASVYRQFQDAHDFVEEIQPMLVEGAAEGRRKTQGVGQRPSDDSPSPKRE